MTYLSDRQIKQLLCEHFSKRNPESCRTRTKIRSSSRIEDGRDVNKAGLLARRSW
jgi:hypothetical protein